MRTTSLDETQAVIRALEFALGRDGFATARQKKTAAALIKSMRSTESVSGRHDQLLSLLKKGATIRQMIKASGTSRRTVFRYLNHFEEAGMDIVLVDGKYKLK